jgi:hypothetical protein
MFDLLIVGGYIILQEPIHEIKKLNLNDRAKMEGHTTKQ